MPLTPTVTSPRGRGTTPAPTALRTPAGTPKTARNADEKDNPSKAPQDSVLAPTLPVAKALLTQLKQLENSFGNKATVAMRQELAKAQAIAEKLELALTVVEGVITRKTLEKILKAELDTTATRIIEGIANDSPSTPAVSYSTAAASMPRASELSVLIELPTSDASTALKALERDALREHVERAMHTVQELAQIQPRVVRFTQKGCLQLLARSVRDAVLIKRHAKIWTVSLQAQSTRGETYTVAVSYTPIDFDPEAPTATSLLHSWNGEVIPHPADIVSTRWLNPAAPKAAGKKRSTMLVELSNPFAASALIYYSCNVAGADGRAHPCTATRYIPNPTQCYRCQGFGHYSSQCQLQASPRPEACARCAGPHSTKLCPCTLEQKCSGTSCDHHAPTRCANCHGDHKASSGLCPHRKKIHEEHIRRPEFANPYFIPNYDPTGVPAV